MGKKIAVKRTNGKLADHWRIGRKQVDLARAISVVMTAYFHQKAAAEDDRDWRWGVEDVLVDAMEIGLGQLEERYLGKRTGEEHAALVRALAAIGEVQS